MKDILIITGGAGFIGTNIAIQAKEQYGYDVIVFDNLHRKNVDQNVRILGEHGIEFKKGDIREQKNFAYLPHTDQVRGVIHLAANPGIPWSIKYPAADFEVNARGTLNVLEYARSFYPHPIPVIYASTNKCYSDLVNEIPLEEKETRYAWNFNQLLMQATEPISYWTDLLLVKKGISKLGVNEKFPTDGYGKYPHSPYGVSKLTGDLYCQEYFQTYGVPTVINRMSCIYGYYQKGVADQGWIDHFVRQAFTDTPTLDIYGDGKQVRDMLWGADVADLYLQELQNISKVQGKVFNIGGGALNTLSLREAIATIEYLSGKKFTLHYHDWRIADQKVYISDVTKIRKQLGWKPTMSPGLGIAHMYEKYKQEGL